MAPHYPRQWLDGGRLSEVVTGAPVLFLDFDGVLHPGSGLSDTRLIHAKTLDASLAQRVVGATGRPTSDAGRASTKSRPGSTTTLRWPTGAHWTMRRSSSQAVPAVDCLPPARGFRAAAGAGTCAVVGVARFRLLLRHFASGRSEFRIEPRCSAERPGARRRVCPFGADTGATHPARMGLPVNAATSASGWSRSTPAPVKGQP